MDIIINSSKQISNFNHFIKPSPFNTGPPIPPPILTLTLSLEDIEMLESKSDSENPTPELSSSPTSTAPSSPRSSRSVLSLDDPEIKKIWGDPRFRPVVPYNLKSFTPAPPLRDEECRLFSTATYGLGPRESFVQAATLNPLAQPFVPCFVAQDLHHSTDMGQVSTFYGDSVLLSPLDFPAYLRSVEESGIYFPTAPVRYEDAFRIDPPYPPGLHPPPQNAGKLHPLGEGPVSATCHPPPCILTEALLPTQDGSARNALLHRLFNHIGRWDFFTLRNLTSMLMMTVFGNERELVVPCSEKACPNHAEEGIEMGESVGQSRITSPEEAFQQVVVGFATILCEKSGRSLADMFLVQIRDSILSRFISYFDSDKPDSLNAYQKTYRMSPCISYIRSAFSLCKAIPLLYQHSIVQRIEVDQFIALLLKDFMSVEHLEALQLIVIGCGMKLWDPPLSLLTTSLPDEGAEGVPVSPLRFAFPPIKQQAKAKLCTDVTMFCSKLDAYKIKRGQSGCISLRGGDWKLSGEIFRAKVKEITDTVHEWEKALVTLIDGGEVL